MNALNHDPFLSRETFFGDLQRIDQRPDPDANPLHGIIFAYDQHIGSPLIVSDGLLRHQESTSLLDRDTDPGIESRQDRSVRIRKDSSEQQRPGGGSQADGCKIEAALVRVALFVKKTHKDRPLYLMNLAGRPMGFPHQPGEIRIADVEVDVDGVDLAQLGQGGALTRTHQASRVLQPSIDPTIERSGDLRIAQIELGQVSGRFCDLQVGLCGIPLISPVVYIFLGGGFLLQQVGVSDQLLFRIIHLGPLQQDLPFSLPKRVLIGVLLNEKKGLAFFDRLPILEEDHFQIPGNPGNELYRKDRLGISGQFQVVIDRPLHRVSDRYLGRRRRRRSLFFARRQENKKDQKRGPHCDAQILSNDPFFSVRHRLSPDATSREAV